MAKKNTRTQTFRAASDPSFGPIPGSLFDSTGRRIRLGFIEGREVINCGLKHEYYYRAELKPGTYFHLHYVGGYSVIDKIVVTKKNIEVYQHFVMLYGDKPAILSGAEIPEAVKKVMERSFSIGALDWYIETLDPNFGKDKLTKGLLSPFVPTKIYFYMENAEAVASMEKVRKRLSELIKGTVWVNREDAFSSIYVEKSSGGIFGKSELASWGESLKESEARETLLKEGLVMEEHLLYCYPLPKTS